MLAGLFDKLTPDVISEAVAAAYGESLDGTIDSYPSYINRVYGIRNQDEVMRIVKFYRPGRWSREAVLEEHRFILDCTEAEIPVVAPIPNINGSSLSEIEVEDDSGEETYRFALYPKMGGRNFDAERDEDWFRLGSIIGRCHGVGKKRESPNRTVCSPGENTAAYIAEIIDERLVHPDCLEEFEEICLGVMDTIKPLFRELPLQRLHGDCHQGNILDRGDEGLLFIDFDDMMSGPPVQDLWLLLPDYADNCTRELTMLLDGYEQFSDFDRREIPLIEPLRFMRMIYFLAWQARQRNDANFLKNFSGWGEKGFWIKEIEDLKVQYQIIQQ
jgi:Ser/Thr protein kinase RdoA (MazF antagonist)